MSDHPLPERLPAMLLPRCALLPHGLLPLHIFEPHYRKMLDDVLRGERVMCVVRKEDEQNPSEFGTAGMVRACVRNPDGTARLLLQGLRRARITEWLPDTHYPLADLSWVVTEVQDFDACCRSARNLARQACRKADEQGSHTSLCAQLRLHLAEAEDPEQVADLLAFNFIRCPDRMQQLVECPVLDARLDILHDEFEKLE